MERYEAYKDSGVEWIGEIPEGWEVVPLKQRYSFTTGFTPDTKRPEYYDLDGFDWVTISDMSSEVVTNTASKISQLAIDEIDPTIIPSGSLMYSFKLSAGKTAFAGKEIYTNEAIASFAPNNPCIRFLRYSSYLIEYAANKNIYGAKLLNASLLRNALLVFPPIKEQQAIADYLDTKTAEIDALVADCEREVELLQEYRKAVISEAVTKGLDPDVPMKDSGIEWIGEIPDKWKCCRVKQVAYISSGATPNRDNYSYWNGTIPWVKTGELQNALISETEECITETALDETSVQLYPAGTILMAMYGQGKTRGMTGMLAMASTTNQACAAIQVYTSDESMFIWQALIAGYDAIRDVALGSGQPNLNAELVSNFHIPLPNSVEEQRRIVAVLDAKTAEIGSLIEAKQSMADKLREYRRSLISEAVTGKFKVPTSSTTEKEA